MHLKPPTFLGARLRPCCHVATLAIPLLALALPSAASATGAPPTTPGAYSASTDAARHAESVARSTTSTAVHGELLEVPTGDLDGLLADLPASDLGLSNAQLASLLASAGGSGLSGQTAALSTLLSSLLGVDPNATLGELSATVQANPVLGALLALAGTEVTPAGIAAALSPEQLSTLLANLTAGAEGGQLAQLISGLAGTLTPEQSATLQTILGALTAELSSEELATLRTALAALPTGLSEEALASLAPAQLADVQDELFATAAPSQLEPVVRDLLGGLTLGSGTAGSLASALGVPLQTLASTLGEAGGEGFAGLPMLTGTLPASGQVMGLIDRTRGLAVGLLTPESEREGVGGSGGGSGSGGGGGTGSDPGGQGSSGSGSGSGDGTGQQGPAGSTGASGASGSGASVALTTLAVMPGASASPASRAMGARIRILAHRVRGRVATIVLLAPAAGRITVRGHGVRATVLRIGRSQRVTLKTVLARGLAASLRAHRRHLRVRLTATFLPARGGASSTAATTVSFA
jgi:hypothetical protein